MGNVRAFIMARSKGGWTEMTEKRVCFWGAYRPNNMPPVAQGQASAFTILLETDPADEAS